MAVKRLFSRWFDDTEIQVGRRRVPGHDDPDVDVDGSDQSLVERRLFHPSFTGQRKHVVQLRQGDDFDLGVVVPVVHHDVGQQVEGAFIVVACAFTTSPFGSLGKHQCQVAERLGLFRAELGQLFEQQNG